MKPAPADKIQPLTDPGWPRAIMTPAHELSHTEEANMTATTRFTNATGAPVRR